MGKKFKTGLIIYFFLVLPVLMAGCGKSNASVSLAEITVPPVQKMPEAEEIKKTNEEVFTGVEWTKEDEEKYALYQGSEDICADRDNGGAYYVNWGYDKYLYYWKDGKTKLVLDKWVSQICYMDGMVYCIYDKTGKSYKSDVTPSYEGVICSVNVKTGEFKKLSETRAKRLAVCRDMLYYSWFTGPEAKKQKEENGFYLFSDKKIYKSASREENGACYTERYGKYAVFYREGAYYIKNLEDGSEQVLLPGNENASVYKLCAGKCYYRIINGHKVTFNTINLENGEKQKLKDGLVEMNLTQLDNNKDYLYTTTPGSGQITVYNPGKDECIDVDIKGTYSSPHSSYFTEGLCSDGRYLYAIAGNGFSKTSIVGLVVLKADGKEISEVWSALEDYNIKNGR